MITIKVKDGTPESRGALCTTCRSARIVKGYRTGEMDIFCGASFPERRVRFLVAECSAYDDTRIVSRRDMEKIAWVLVTKTAGRSRLCYGGAIPGDGRRRRGDSVGDDPIEVEKVVWKCSVKTRGKEES